MPNTASAGSTKERYFYLQFPPMLNTSAIPAVFLLAAASLFAPGAPEGNVSGRIIPPEGARTVWAIAAKDSIHTGIAEGAFSLSLKPGSWKILIAAEPPFRNAIFESVKITDGEDTDLGEIRLQR